MARLAEELRAVLARYLADLSAALDGRARG
jgi:hypothetical protein